MPKFTLTAEHEDGSINTMSFEKEHLYDIVDTLDMFLRGSGFFYSKSLIIPEDEESIEFSSEVDFDLNEYAGDDLDPWQFSDSDIIFIPETDSFINETQAVYAFDQMTNTLNTYGEQSTTNAQFCQRCFIPKDRMINNTCWDETCPLRGPGKTRTDPIV